MQFGTLTRYASPVQASAPGSGAASPPPPAAAGGLAAASVAATAIAAPVQPVAATAAAAPGRGTDEAEARQAPPETAPQAEREDEPAAEGATAPADTGKAPVMALMRQAAVACRMANAAGGDGGGNLGFAMIQAQGGLQVRGNLVVAGPDGYHVGSGQIYREGQLVAAFAGNNLSLFSARVSALV